MFYKSSIRIALNDFISLISFTLTLNVLFISPISGFYYSEDNDFVTWLPPSRFVLSNTAASRPKASNVLLII